MRAFTVFCKKEFMEGLRTYRLVILLAVFIILGIMSPMVAKMLPAILGSMDSLGIAITLPEPTASDAWAQFFKNVGQMGMLTLIIIFSGIMANEFTRGTLVNLLTKGLRRETVILAKFSAASAVWALAYALSLGVTAAYTAYYWEINIQNAIPAFGSLWLFGELLIALLIFGGTLFSNFYGSLLTAFAAVIAMTLIGIAPQTAGFNPISLSGGTLGLLSGAQSVGDFAPAFAITALAVAALLLGSIAVFKKKAV